MVIQTWSLRWLGQKWKGFCVTVVVFLLKDKSFIPQLKSVGVSRIQWLVHFCKREADTLIESSDGSSAISPECYSQKDTDSIFTVVTWNVVTGTSFKILENIYKTICLSSVFIFQDETLLYFVPLLCTANPCDPSRYQSSVIYFWLK